MTSALGLASLSKKATDLAAQHTPQRSNPWHSSLSGPGLSNGRDWSQTIMGLTLSTPGISRRASSWASSARFVMLSIHL